MHYCFLNMAIEFYSPVSGGAISTIIRHLAGELIDRGHRVTVLTRVNADPVHDVGEVVPLAYDGRAVRGRLRRVVAILYQNLQGWEFTEYGAYRRAFTAALRALPEPPDVVFVFNDFVSSRYLKGVCPGARTVVWLQNECRPRGNPARLTGWTDRFLTCSDYIRDWTMRHWRLAGDRITTILNGVDPAQFTPAPWFPRPPWRELRVLFVGRIDPNKGPDLAADAVATLQAEGFDVRFTVAGGLWFYGNEHPERDPFFRALKAKLDATGGRYLGHVNRDAIPALFREHDVVLVLSRSREPFGLVTLEAMACGCAVIASNRGGLPEACGDAATLVDPDQPAQTVAALRSFLSDPDALPAARRRALERGRALSWSTQAQALERVISPGEAPAKSRHPSDYAVSLSGH